MQLYDAIQKINELNILVYENQRFLVEQDTSIMMELDYSEYLNESVRDILKKIQRGVLLVIEKIKKLFNRVISFFTKRKNSNDNDTTDIKDIDNTEIKKYSETVEKVDKSVEKIIATFELKNLDTRINQIHEELQKLSTDEKYTKVIFDYNLDATKFIRKMLENDVIIVLLDCLDECINCLQDDNILKSMNDSKYNGIIFTNEFYNKYKNLGKYIDGIKPENNSVWGPSFYEREYYKNNKNDKYIIRTVTDFDIIIDDKKCNIKKFYIKSNHEDILKYYECITECANLLRRTLKDQIEPAETQMKKLENHKNSEDFPNAFKYIYNILYKCVSRLFSIFNQQLSEIMKIERACSIYIDSIKMYKKDSEKLDKLINELVNIGRTAKEKSNLYGIKIDHDRLYDLTSELKLLYKYKCGFS